MAFSELASTVPRGLEGLNPIWRVQARRPWALPHLGPCGTGAPGRPREQKAGVAACVHSGALVLTAHLSFQAADKGELESATSPQTRTGRAHHQPKRANLSPDRVSLCPWSAVCPEKC